MDADREARVIDRMEYYKHTWTKLRERASKSTQRPVTRTLLHSSETYKLKKSVIENLNAAYRLHEFSNDNIWYLSMRDDAHPNDHNCFDLETASIAGISLNEWDKETDYSPWKDDEYFQKRLTTYRSDLEKRAPYCLSFPVGLEIVGRRIPVPQDQRNEIESELELTTIRSIIQEHISV